jgi:predicted ferric reductase
VTAQLDERFWWYLARSSGIVSWLLLSAAVLWGLLYSSRMIPVRSAPRWLLDLHRFLGGIATLFVAVHLTTLVLDSYVQFGPADLFVPLASSWKPVPVAWGVLSLYLLLAVELTSLAMRRIPRSLWRAIHASSFVLFVVATIHVFTAGTDARSVPMLVTATVILTSVAFALAYRVVVAISPVPRVSPVNRAARPQNEHARRTA